MAEKTFGYPSIITGDGNLYVVLPPQFSYKPLVPVKRSSVVQTVKDTVYRESPYLVDSDILIPWTLERVCKKDYDVMRNLFNVVPSPTYTFTGYWGDKFTFIFFALDQPTVRERLWDFSGSFRVQEINTFSDSTQF